MNQNRSSLETELDAAFATVQAARLRHELGYEDAYKMARDCVTAAFGSINRTLSKNPLSPAETHLIQAKLKALIGAAARIPAPPTAAEDEQGAPIRPALFRN